MFFRSIVTVLCTGYTYASVVINQNTITTNGQVGSIKDGITIGEGVFWSVFQDGSFESDDLQVQDSAAFYITSTDDDSSTKFESLLNLNIAAMLNPSGLTNTPVTISGQRIQNYGNLFISNACSVDLIADQWVNEGAIVITGPNVDVKPEVTIQTTGQIYNQGDICLTNQYAIVAQQFSGGGCIHVIERSTLVLFTTDPNTTIDNTIVLDGSGAVLGFNPSGSTYTVGGYGGGNAIAVPNNKMKYEYDDQSGILTLTTLKHSDNFNIGLGYDQTKFSLQYGSALFYIGAVPNAPPSQCGVCPPIPVAPSP